MYLNMIVIQFVIVFLILVSKQATALESFVVGGEYALINDYPHLGLMSGTCGDREKWMCSSSILNQRILLTAAHCLQQCNINPNRQPFTGDRIAVFFGSTFLKHMEFARVVDYTASHDAWDEIQGSNDIAIALVRKDIPFGTNVKRVAISKIFPSILNNIFFESYVAGWGLKHKDQYGPTDHLRHAYQKVRTHEECSRYGKLYEGMFCAGRMRDDGDHPSKGDSGGALVSRNRYQQIGIISFGWVMYPAMTVYTNTSYYYEWITENTERLYCISKTAQKNKVSVSSEIKSGEKT